MVGSKVMEERQQVKLGRMGRKRDVAVAAFQEQSESLFVRFLQRTVDI